MTSQKLDSVYLKIERAKKHIVEVNSLSKSFHDTRPYRFRADKDSESGQVVYYLTSVDCMPAEIPLIAGEVIHALRSALDHLAFQIWMAHGGTGPERDVYFPIAADAADYETKILRQVYGVPQRIVDAFRAVEAYKGGNGNDLWVIQALDNTDKHRALLTAGSIHKTFDLGKFAWRNFIQRGVEFWAGDPPENIGNSLINLHIEPANTAFPAKEGDVLLVVGGDVEVDKDAEFTMDIAFHEPGIIDGEPILIALPKMVDVVSNITSQLAALVEASHSSPPSPE